MNRPSRKAVVRTVGVILATVLAGAYWIGQRRQEQAAAKPTIITSLEGDRVSYLGQSVQWATDRPVFFSVGFPMPSGSTEEDKEKSADKLFEAYAGPRAEELGFHSVLLHADDEARSDGINILGFRFSFHASVGMGPLPADADRIAYDRKADGVWTRDGYQPDAPPTVTEYSLPSGERFGLSEIVEDFPRATFVFDCLTCKPDSAIREVVANIHALLKAAVISAADRDGIKAVKCVIFFERRKSSWVFPRRLNVEISKRSDGEWIAPKLSNEQWIKALSTYYLKMDTEGRRLRREAR
jgi:hypothetical protein